MEPRLQIAVQKSGRLLDDSMKLLKECGIKVDNRRDQLKASSHSFPVDILYLRNSDIPKYVDDGVADLGILGENTIIEKGKPLQILERLGFSKCRLSIAVPKGVDYTGLQWLQGKRIATSYTHTLKEYLSRHQIDATIHEISGSVEIAPNIGLADAICDLVSTGSTLFKNNLEEQDILLKSEACLVTGSQPRQEVEMHVEALRFRIRSVMAARGNRYLLMNAPNDRVAEITNILPGMKSPTVMPLAVEGWSSIHTVISDAKFWDIIEQLKAAGAQGILIIPIEKMIL